MDPPTDAGDGAEVAVGGVVDDVALTREKFIMLVEESLDDQLTPTSTTCARSWYVPDTGAQLPMATVSFAVPSRGSPVGSAPVLATVTRYTNP